MSESVSLVLSTNIALNMVLLVEANKALRRAAAQSQPQKEV